MQVRLGASAAFLRAFFLHKIVVVARIHDRALRPNGFNELPHHYYLKLHCDCRGIHKLTMQISHGALLDSRRCSAPICLVGKSSFRGVHATAGVGRMGD